MRPVRRRASRATVSSTETLPPWLAAVDVPEGATLLSAEVAFPGGQPGFFGFSLRYDVDRDGILSEADETVNAVNHENNPRDEAVLPKPGRYFVYFTGDPARFDLRTWVVADETPDDDALTLDGDPQSAFPAAERTFRLRWSGAGGGEPQRGVVVWKDGERTLSASVIDVTG